VASEIHAPAHVTHVHPAHDEHDGHDGHEGHHGPVQHQFDDINQQRESNTLGMWLFLATEVMMFGGLFFAYSLYRGMYPGAFHVGSEHLNITLGTANTFVLLFSSLTMALAVHAASEGKTRRMVGWLFFTWLLGAAFIGIKAIEWGHDYDIGLIPGVNWTYYDKHPDELHHLEAQNTGVNQVMMYWVIYFCMTGLHAIHMVVGLGLVLTFIILGARGRFEKGNEQPVEIMGLYWHLVDIIWIFLFPLLYLIAGFHPGKGGH
jgi:cytochrome c oxidase subunit III